MEYDYAAAWWYVLRPEYDGLPDEVKELVNWFCTPTGRKVRQLDNLSMPMVPAIASRLASISTRDLARFAETVHAYGYNMPVHHKIPWGKYKPAVQSTGAYWKAEKAMKQAWAHRKGREPMASFPSPDTERFMVSATRMKQLDAWRKKAPETWWFEEPPEDLWVYPDGEDLDYVGEWLDHRMSPAGREHGLQVVRAVTVNHRIKDDVARHLVGRDRRLPFCIGNQHIKNSRGGYLDPRSAPCTRTGLHYDDFTCDKVAVVFAPCLVAASGEEDVPAYLQDELKHLEEISTLGGRRLIDGFVFTRNPERRK